MVSGLFDGPVLPAVSPQDLGQMNLHLGSSLAPRSYLSGREDEPDIAEIEEIMEFSRGRKNQIKFQ